MRELRHPVRGAGEVGLNAHLGGRHSIHAVSPGDALCIRPDHVRGGNGGKAGELVAVLGIVPAVAGALVCMTVPRHHLAHVALVAALQAAVHVAVLVVAVEGLLQDGRHIGAVAASGGSATTTATRCVVVIRIRTGSAGGPLIFSPS